jgi:hypothetical protein
VHLRSCHWITVVMILRIHCKISFSEPSSIRGCPPSLRSIPSLHQRSLKTRSHPPIEIGICNSTWATMKTWKLSCDRKYTLWKSGTRKTPQAALSLRQLWKGPSSRFSAEILGAPTFALSVSSNEILGEPRHRSLFSAFRAAVATRYFTAKFPRMLTVNRSLISE